MFKFIWNEELQCYCAEHNPTIRADKNGNVFGGGSTSISEPNPPAQPSTADAVNAWVQSMPQVYQTQMQYAPLQAQQQVELAQKYAQPYGEALKKANEALYPGTSALQEKLAGQALEGMSGEVPEWYKKQWKDYYNTNLGTNAGSGIGADYVSRGMSEQIKGWGDYYRNLALSVTNRQPLTQATTPQTTDYMSQFTPTANMNYMANTYGTYGSLYGNMYNTNAQMAQTNAMMPYAYMTGVGNLMGGVGSMMGGGKK